MTLIRISPCAQHRFLGFSENWKHLGYNLQIGKHSESFQVSRSTGAHSIHNVLVHVTRWTVPENIMCKVGCLLTVQFRINKSRWFVCTVVAFTSIASWLLLTHTYFFLHPLFFIHVKYACLNAIWWPNGEPQLLTSMHFQQHCRTGTKYIFTCSACNKYVWNSKNLKHTKNQTCRSLYSFQIWNKLKPWPCLNIVTDW